MAAFGASFRPSAFSSSLSLNLIASRVFYILTLLPLALAAFAFLLQWRGGGVIDPAATDRFQFPGMVVPHSSISDSVDLLASSHTSFFRDLKFNLDPKTKISIASSTSAGLQQILPWILYHKVIGVSNFFLFAEGTAASHNVTRVLQSIPGVKVVCRTKQLEQHQAKSRIWNEAWLASFLYKPCNYELFVKQCLNMEMAVVMARDAGMEWIFHLDTDELIHPAGTSEYSVKQLLDEVPENVDIAVFPNYEGCVERDDVKEPFSEVSMFKKNYDHLSKVIYYIYYREVARNNPSYYLTYGNGKSAARVQDHLRPHGAHRWENYMKVPVELKLENAAILHYTYNRFSDLTSRRDRCNCKPTKEGVKKCFMLSFDRNAYIIASTATRQEMLRWYREHVVWTNKTLSTRFLQLGLLTRIHAPMVILQGLREAGVFTSVIESSLHTNVTEDGLFSSVQTSNSSREVTSAAFSSRKVGKTTESDATARKVLEATREGIHKAAMPPLPPPDPSELDRDMVMLELKMALPF